MPIMMSIVPSAMPFLTRCSSLEPTSREGVMAGLLDGLYLYVLWTRKRAAARQEAPARAASLGDVPVPA